MSEGLFRKEAVEFATQRLYGHVIVLPKVSHVFALVLLLLGAVLFVSALLIGSRVEQETIRGELRYRVTGGADAELFVPATLAQHLQAGDQLFLSATGFDSGSVGRIAAVVQRVGGQRVIRQPSATEAGRVYIPATLAIDADGLREAGLPSTQDVTLAVETRIVSRRQSWMRWLLDALGAGDAAK